MMFSKKQKYALILIAALGGAVFGGLWGEVWGNPIDGLTAKRITLPAGIISGFIACLIISIIYLRRLEKTRQHFKFSLGTLFGMLAGIISGAITGAGMAFTEPFRNVGQLLASILFMLFAGAVCGGGSGAIIGLISTSFILVIPAVFRRIASGTKLPQNIASLTCYLGFWLTGLVFFITSRQNKIVRFHAMQSVVVFGGLTIVWIALGWVPETISIRNIQFNDMSELLRDPLILVSGILWIILMIGANNGNQIRIPLAARVAEKYAGKVKAA